MVDPTLDDLTIASTSNGENIKVLPDFPPMQCTTHKK